MNILFICTHNRCRSILSEAIANHLAGGKLTAYSAGSQPVGEVHPLSLRYLAEKGISTEGLHSQSWNDFAAQRLDIVVTVCDSAASEPCPVWFGDCVTVHWGLPDPSKIEADEATVRAAFLAVMQTIENRINALLALNLADRPRASWSTELLKIGEDVH
ncbi:arsenate reductase [Teredinibacter turnerae T7901]|uniref:Arsenate reductase n=1 Tax=Teredinibacter turnerae (strain ATCC 39867 / T7901) TaxID=377629 RepID=C5BIL2_TERTT|nr:arsenate reductase ArsC [Teredinibacter turnerae]ACR11331.1 arsenate reductase [Teredinibacter turnerae T7901]